MAGVERYQHYEILKREDGSLWELGRGAMGITYKAFDTNLRFQVAIKVINSTYLESDTARQRFLREARAAVALRHPNVASVFNLGTEEDEVYYVMEFIDGETVEARVKRQGPLEPVEALDIGLQVTRALAVAAKQHLVHRALKPTNLMLVDQGGEQMVKVIDFGLAKVLKDSDEDSGALTVGGFVGMPHFASPEQLEEGDSDVRSDIYSLGVSLYFALTGQPPFSGSSVQVMGQQLYKPLPITPLAHLPRCVVFLLEHMMEKDPSKRPQTPQDLQRDILACLEEIRSSPIQSPYPADETASAFETKFSLEELPEATLLDEAKSKMAGVERYQHYEVFKRADGSLWELGRGAMGVTYKAFDPNLRFTVALKVINSAYLESDTARQRFLREARAAAALRHRNVASVFHLGTDHGRYFYAMEFIDGQTVDEYVKQRGRLEPTETLDIALQVARALAAAARRQLVHRDLKPPNLMLVDEDGERIVKVIDFGLAKSLKGEGKDTRTATVGEGFVGTPLFASPEQIEERDIDIRSDIYSLGATLYYLVTGHPPFAGSVAQIMIQHLYKQVPTEPLQGYPVPFVNLILSMMEKDRDKRPQGATELRQTIQYCIRELSTEAESAQAVDLPGQPSLELMDLARGPSLEATGSEAMGTASIASTGAMGSGCATRQNIRSADDRVSFSVFAPGVICPAQQFILDLWAHLPTQTDEVTSLAREFARDRRLGLRAQVAVARRAALSIVLDLPSLRIKDPSDTIFWDGVPVYASFVVEVPADVAIGGHVGQLIISSSGIPIAKVAFYLPIEPAGMRGEEGLRGLPIIRHQPRSAFASFSGHDRTAVLGRVQGMTKVCRDLDVFVDVLSLRSGEDWEMQIRQQIPVRDVFFLFWSLNASRSKEVDKEWRVALEMRGLDYIDPIPLTDPRVSPPPKELIRLHFNDLYVAQIKMENSLKKLQKRRWWQLWHPVN
jgi:serine/threonine protein kinase